tara:strand:+ start:168 stop:398 length:231 start_codon:yes stop_codon:yes gene_type:complete
VCEKVLHGHSSRTKCCGCENMTTVTGDNVSAEDLSKVEMLNNINNYKKTNILSPEDLKYQEARRQRKVRKLTFEER